MSEVGGEGGGVFDGLENMAVDAVDALATDAIGLGVAENDLHAVRAVVDLGAAAYHTATGTGSPSQDLGDAEMDGIEALPFHETAFDGLFTLARAIDGPDSADRPSPMWDQGGDELLRDALGGSPRGGSQSDQTSSLSPFPEPDTAMMSGSQQDTSLAVGSQASGGL
jgi:hypothetical protein